MYEAHDDPYCYPGTSVLRNKLDLRTQEELDAFEASMTHQRADEPLPRGSLGHEHYCAIHRHLFQDIFDWAGEIRTVRIAKSGSVFCYPENIEKEMRRVFRELAERNLLRGLNAKALADAAAHILAELNAIHPFREGNGRTQSAFLMVLAEAAEHSIELERLDPKAMLDAMVTSFAGDERPLAETIRRLIRG